MGTTYEITDCLRVPNTEDFTILVIDRDYEIEGTGFLLIDGERFSYMPNSVKRWLIIHTKKDFKGKTVTVI